MAAASPVSSQQNNTRESISDEAFAYGAHEYPPSEQRHEPGQMYYTTLFYSGSISLNEFIHQRFCAIYPVHRWAHDSVIRALLFLTFTRLDRLPTVDEVCSIFILAKDLRKTLPNDLWMNISNVLNEHSISQWREHHKEDTPQNLQPPPFKPSTALERCLCLILTASTVSLRSFGDFPVGDEVDMFIVDPLRDNRDADELWRLPSIGHSPKTAPLNKLPDVPSASCTCGSCQAQSAKIQKNTSRFRVAYSALVREGQRRGCQALEEAWEPFLIETEEWFEASIVRVQATSEILPSDDRMGPMVIDAINRLGIRLGQEISTREVMRLLATLRLPFFSASEEKPLPRPLLPSELGYVSNSVGDSPVELAVILGGNLLPELAGFSLDHPRSLAIVLSSDDCSIQRVQYINPNGITMPLCPTPDKAFHTPTHHTNPNFRLPDDEEAESVDETGKFAIHLSNKATDGFPIFSFDPAHEPGHGSWQAMKLSASFAGTNFETWWRPTVFLGRRCPHSDLHGKATRCSLNARDVLLQWRTSSSMLDQEIEQLLESRPIKPVSSYYKQQVTELTGNDDTRYLGDLNDKEALKAHNQWVEDTNKWHHSYTQALTATVSHKAELLKQSGGPFERHKAILIRCSQEDELKPLVFLSASCGRKVYMINYDECWDCACQEMLREGYAVGIATNIQMISTCHECEAAKERAADIIAGR
ncbi:hypothetical protein SISSUDRAFT_1122964 [Sistotremastrum suecicum HHB10207 ss-3]|uniref:Uncharacterized protein n=1 Tax=Sistotremastrum suecicum HHB10207 ss-3 TaxID=1314776 RepID=A0A165YHQ5_9AGAM|nr:hypothetical protein SISSUDRAFT_1122964 [Sistotremastrum suecicum HHB10207 ss-3]